MKRAASAAWRALAFGLAVAGLLLALAGCDTRTTSGPQPTPCPDSMSCRALKRLNTAQPSGEQEP
jgi:hypothetical protein